MRKTWCVWLCIVILGAMSSATLRAAQETSPGEKFLGTWSGTWEGAGSGSFELTLEKEKDGVLGGNVSVGGEPTYKAVLKTVSFDGMKMSARYDFTPDEAAEVVLAATFDGNSAKGTWSLRAKANGTEVASGTWTVTKK